MNLRNMKAQCMSAAVASLRRVSTSIRFVGKSISVHPSAWVSLRSVVRVNCGGSITIGKNCEIHPYSMLLTHGGDIQLGDNSSVNPFTIIYGSGGAYIGKNVRIAAHVMIVPENHNPGSDDVPLRLSGKTSKGIRIDDNVWIGAGAKILDGVSIGRNAVIGAGSVVTHSVPANSTAVGVPARVVKTRARLNAMSDGSR
jgi:acetyltransferase-like isoleucine patch superfamily enzyme